MIRLTYLLRRKPDLSLEEFQTYWREKHGPLVAGHAERLNILRYVQVHTLDDPINAALPGNRKMLEPYDGVAELWWTGREAFMAASASEEGRAAGAELIEDEKQFIDLPDSPIWAAYEYPQVNPSPENIVALENSSLLKFYYPLRHLPGMTMEEAQLYWRTSHGPIIRRMAPQMGILRYVQVHRFEDELEKGLREARGTKEPPFMGHAELWFDRTGMMTGFEMPERIRANEAAYADESKFIDFSRSAMWVAKEHVFVDRR
ncbi:MAG: EthD domain-containing protein [Desulfobacterales bacterium]